MNAAVRFGREICGDLQAVESREWLVTNGIGGYASGTVAGGTSRRYHGLLIAALRPPMGRTQLVAWVDEIVRADGREFALATHRWISGAVEPQGFRFIDEFRLERTIPVWTFALGRARLEKRLWMQQGTNTTYVQYVALEGEGSLELELKALVNYRDFHGATHAGDWRMQVDRVDAGVRVLAFEGANPVYLKSAELSCEPRHTWYRDCFWPQEHARGLDDREDHLFAAEFRARLDIGGSATLVLSTDVSAALDGEAGKARRAAHESSLFAGWNIANEELSPTAPDWIQQLVLAADQFIVKRVISGLPDAHSVIAGYHWFGDWGRDTMIALPGLALATGRFDLARQILLAFSRYADRGMLPNYFPDAGGKPEYNSVDAGLWYFEAIRQYFAVTNDREALQKLCPVLNEMIEAHLRGTRYRIQVDASDGLLYAGEPGVQLTWMDAKIGDWVVTPRIGKAVEINALWINALETMAGFARVLGNKPEEYERLARRARAGFSRFWNEQRGCCYDVIDSPDIGNDASLRPNQIFAVALPVSALTSAQQQAVVDFCSGRLLTPYGLRSLAADEPGYEGHYRGGPHERDAAYHQGTVWGWLLGPYALAHFRVYRNRADSLRVFNAIPELIRTYGLGSLPEIFDGDAPFTPRGCIAQAWTVGEVLRVWTELTRLPLQPTPAQPQ